MVVCYWVMIINVLLLLIRHYPWFRLPFIWTKFVPSLVKIGQTSKSEFFFESCPCILVHCVMFHYNWHIMVLKKKIFKICQYFFHYVVIIYPWSWMWLFISRNLNSLHYRIPTIRIWVTTGVQHILKLNGSVLWMRPQKPRPHVTAGVARSRSLLSQRQ